MNEINKVMPVHNRIQYWHKYKPYMNRIINKYSIQAVDIDDFYIYCWSEIFSKNFVEFTGYICEAIRRIASSFWHREISKEYADSKLTGYMIDNNCHLDITVNDYVNDRFFKYLINRLEERQRTVLQMYFGIAPYSQTYLKDIAKKLGISATRARAIKEQGLKKLRSILNNRQIYNVEDFIYG